MSAITAIGTDDPITLEEACRLYYPNGPFTPGSLRKEIHYGRLWPEKIGGRVFVTRKYLTEMEERRASAFLGVEGNVYVIGFGPYVKIGYTRGAVSARVRDLETGCPEPMTIYGSTRGTYEDEKALHARFAHLRLRGEWFRLEGELAAYIEALAK